MLNDAIKKLQTEIDANKDDKSIEVIGNFLLKHLESSPESAKKVLADGKTITKSYDEMANVARKQAKNNRAMLTDEEGFDVVLKYYGIEKPAVISATADPVPEKKSVEFDVKLEDLL